MAELPGCNQENIYTRVPEHLSKQCSNKKGNRVDEMDTIKRELKSTNDVIYEKYEIPASLNYSTRVQQLCMFYMLYHKKRGGIDLTECTTRYDMIWKVPVTLANGINANGLMVTEKFRGNLNVAAQYISVATAGLARGIDPFRIKSVDDLTWWKNWYEIHDYIMNRKNSITINFSRLESNLHEEARRQQEIARRKKIEQHERSQMKMHNVNATPILPKYYSNSHSRSLGSNGYTSNSSIRSNGATSSSSVRSRSITPNLSNQPPLFRSLSATSSSSVGSNENKFRTHIASNAETSSPSLGNRSTTPNSSNQPKLLTPLPVIPPKSGQKPATGKKRYTTGRKTRPVNFNESSSNSKVANSNSEYAKKVEDMHKLAIQFSSGGLRKKRTRRQTRRKHRTHKRKH